jgi:hypothetical protein
MCVSSSSARIFLFFCDAFVALARRNEQPSCFGWNQSECDAACRSWRCSSPRAALLVAMGRARSSRGESNRKRRDCSLADADVTMRKRLESLGGDAKRKYNKCIY